jgi:phage-related protein
VGGELVLLHAVQKARRLAPKEFALAAERLQDWKRRTQT